MSAPFARKVAERSTAAALAYRSATSSTRAHAQTHLQSGALVYAPLPCIRRSASFQTGPSASFSASSSRSRAFKHHHFGPRRTRIIGNRSSRNIRSLTGSLKQRRIRSKSPLDANVNSIITTGTRDRQHTVCYPDVFNCTFSFCSSGGRRFFSGSDGDFVEPVLDVQALQQSILDRAEEMSTQLSTCGYYTTTTGILQEDMIGLIREQAVTLRNLGRYEPSWSERIVATTGKVERFDKEGVYACEPDGRDYYDAPDLIAYMSGLLQTLPSALSDQHLPTAEIGLSSDAFNAKLAVTSPGGCGYPLHIDNPHHGGLAVGDTRKLTCILYLNPTYRDGDGGELRLYLPSSMSMSTSPDSEQNDTVCEELDIVDLSPEGGRLLLFWSDEIPHEVLPTKGSRDNSALDRYALTVWIPTANVTKLHDDMSKFRHLKDLAPF